MKFIKQNDKCSCAPIAGLNAIKWMGAKINAADFETSILAFKIIFATNENGTTMENVISGIESLNITDKYYTSPTLKKLDRELKKGKAAIISYWGKDIKGRDYGHAILCVKKIRNHYKIVNHSRAYPDTIQYIQKDLMKRHLRHINPFNIKSKVWFINRSNE